ncbi:MAG: hypothetical protein MZU91_12110 [Desulfosudis oleivorans]|nr:hypothetical protein [Desulfosudis oleivorans]
MSRLTVKQLLQRDVPVEKLRAQIGAIERLFAEHPPGFEIARSQPLPNCGAEWLRAKGSKTDRVILHFPGGAYVARLPNMERADDGSTVHGRKCARAARVLPACTRTPVSGRSRGQPRRLPAVARTRYRTRPHHRQRNFRGRRHGARRAAGSARSRAAAARRSDPDVAADRPDGSSRRFARDQRRPRFSPEPQAWHRDAGNVRRRRYRTDGSSLRLACVRRLYRPARTFLPGGQHRDPARRQPALRGTRARVGVTAELEVWKEMPHGWQGLPFGPESERAIEHCADFVRECCP